MILTIPPKRVFDDWGSGEFAASRGDKKHKGIDYKCYSETLICASVGGVVTKLGYAYSDDLSYRYVEISKDSLRHRYFYLSPTVKVGDIINRGDVIGISQNIAKKYSGRNDADGRFMFNHCHYEILKNDDTPINPEEFHG